ncbi:hypothetical protein GK091_21765 [Spirosoma agri]|uniref:Uncharacterized protein n=2 Tax=Spirosoma agri TaxID=1987381 RepID=A0A6M0IML6_9BACT|nr:hypothetical protein [Spirosoma agri]
MEYVMKATVKNISCLWFGADTPIRSYKIKLNPDLWATCQRVNREFIPPSGARALSQYRKSDMTLFAKTVQQQFTQGK